MNITKVQRIDLAKIRSDHSVSQKDLAEKLGVKQSFLSNIERGRSPLPPEKLDKIIEIFDIENIDIYYIEDIGSSNMSKSQSDNTNSIINDSAIFEKFVGVMEKMTEAKYANETEALSRIERLQDRNDFLNSQVDELRKDLTRLLHENFALKEILIKNGIDYETRQYYDNV